MRDALTLSAQVAQEVPKGALAVGAATMSAGVATALQALTVVVGLLATSAGLALTIYLIYKTRLDIELNKAKLAEYEERRNGNGA